MERPEQLGTTRATASTTSKAPEQVAPKQCLPGTARATASTTSEASEQVAPEQSLPGTPVEKQVPDSNQSVLEQTTAPTWLTQGGLPDAAARGQISGNVITSRATSREKANQCRAGGKV
jgi:hypothetical protein